ncbi:hydrophobe/amphiphile efflux-1 [Sesbania bispinosa]|nr:hydrophobe/amphiphile efflux-1 [Sesbania bispinosa]
MRPFEAHSVIVASSSSSVVVVFNCLLSLFEDWRLCMLWERWLCVLWQWPVCMCSAVFTILWSNVIFCSTDTEEL